MLLLSLLNEWFVKSRLIERVREEEGTHDHRASREGERSERGTGETDSKFDN